MTLARRLAAWAAATTVAAGLILPGPAAQPPPTTLARTIGDLDGDGRLEYGPGEPVAVREDLAKANPNRKSTRDALVSFVGFADLQLADEESPLRGEWADKCGTPPTKAAFRPQETMVPHLINSEVLAANQIAGGPVTGRPFDFAVQLGDAADNQQRNEVRWFVDLLDGGTLVDPDSGADGYEGVQGRDPFPSPVSGASLLALANEPFFATGLRRPDGTAVPWYSVLGNHDAKVQGTMPNLPGWVEFARLWAQGMLKIQDLAPDQQQRVCANPGLLGDPAFWMEVAQTPGTTRRVTPDPERALLAREQWMAEHLPPDEAKKIDPEATGSAGLPAGHGFLAGRCADPSGKPLARLCYAFDQGGVHFVVIDTNADEGLDSGNVDQDQMEWLERDLVAHSPVYYDAEGVVKRNAAATPSLVVVFSHHTRDTIDNEAPPMDDRRRFYGEDLEKLLHRFPTVVLHAAGHTHENRVWARPGRAANATTGAPATGYWEVNTSSHADWPHQSRTIEIADNRDGTLSIFGVVFDAAAPPKALRADQAAKGGLPWAEDATDETALPGGTVRINEEYLAAVAREVGYNDPQAGKTDPDARGRDPKDRNVELLVAHPFGVTVRLKGPPPFVGRAFFAPPAFRPSFGQPPSGFRDLNPRRPPVAPFLPPVRPFYGGTAKGLGAPARDAAVPSYPVRGGFMVLIALGSAVWLFRARVRDWMIGLSSR